MIIATEHQEQAALVQWARVTRCQGRPIADYLVMIPNESLMSFLPTRNRRNALWGKLLDMGFRKGASDLFLALPVGTCPGLWIEMKRGAKAFPTPRARERAVSDHQREFLQRMEAVGYQVKVAYGWEEARVCIERYLQIGSASDLVPRIQEGVRHGHHG